MRADLRLTTHIHERLRCLSVERQVEFDGDINMPDTINERTALLTWLDGLAAVAAEAQAAGAAFVSDPPTGGRLTVVPDPIAGSCGLQMPIRARDPLRKLLGEIAVKAEQGRGDGTLWLRFNVTRWFFHQLISSEERKRVPTRNNLVRTLERNLALYPHVAGLVLSSEPISIADRVVNERVRLPGAAAAVVRTTQYPWYRSTFVVPGPARVTAREHGGEWLSWYQGEGDWLDWALAESSLPPASDLLTS
jgi:hypothetical protein